MAIDFKGAHFPKKCHPLRRFFLLRALSRFLS